MSYDFLLKLLSHHYSLGHAEWPISNVEHQPFACAVYEPQEQQALECCWPAH